MPGRRHRCRGIANAGQPRRGLSWRAPFGAGARRPGSCDLGRHGDHDPRGQSRRPGAGRPRGRAPRGDPSVGAVRRRRRYRACGSRQPDRPVRGRRRQPAPPSHGFAQSTEPAGGRARGGGTRGRACLRAVAGRPAGGRSVHARGGGDGEAQVRPSRIGDDGNAGRRAADDFRTTSEKPMPMSWSSPSKPTR